MRPRGGGGLTTLKTPKRAHFADRRQSAGGGCKNSNLFYQRRINTELRNDLATKLEVVTHDIDTFTTGTPGAVVLDAAHGDVTGLYVAGRVCDIRDPAHTGGNDNLTSEAPYIVSSSSFAAGQTTVNFEATVFDNGMQVYQNTVPGLVTYDKIVSLVAGEYYEMQHWMDAASSVTSMGWTYAPGFSVPLGDVLDISQLEIILTEYDS